MTDRPSWHEPIDLGSYGTAALELDLSTDAEGLLTRLVAAQVFRTGGAEFFDALARFLNAAVDADLVFVGVLDPQEPGIVNTKVTFEAGERVENFRYDIEGTPCSTVVGPQNLCVYPDYVTELFPEDTGLTQMGARGYAGMPLLDRDGKMIGICALVTINPIEEPQSLISLMRLFGNRAALELERALAIRAATDEVAEIERLSRAEEERLHAALGESLS